MKAFSDEDHVTDLPNLCRDGLIHGADRGVDRVQERPELDRPIPAVPLADHPATLGVEGREERRGAVPHVVVSAPLDLSRTQRPQELAPVQCLNLRLVIDISDADRLRQRAFEDPNIDVAGVARIEDVELIGPALEIAELAAAPFGPDFTGILGC